MKYYWRNGAWRDNDGNIIESRDQVYAPMIQSDLPAYFSVASMKWMDGRRARRDDLKRTGCREVDPSEGPKTVKSKKLAQNLKLEHDPNAGRPKHWPDYFTGKRVD